MEYDNDDAPHFPHVSHLQHDLGVEQRREWQSVPIGDIPSFAPFAGKATSCRMDKYERARILGTRSINIHHGFPPLVKMEATDHPIDVARKEMAQKKLPAFVRRHFPDSSYEDWNVQDLVILR